MLFHMSIAAHDPRHVAEVFAELIGGCAFPFPPVSDDGWIAMCDDACRTSVEVYPLGTVLREADGDADAYGELSGQDRFTPSHGAVGTTLTIDAVFAIAAREGWPAKYRKRGGMFGVVELWIEGRQMFEILTPEMQAEYLATMTQKGWRALLESAAVAG